MPSLRLAIAGAGAVVEYLHLPAVRLCPEVRVVALADTNVARARDLSARFAIPRALADYRELGQEADAVLVALPNALHAPAAIQFLRQGLPVLVEKPMALNVADGREMIDAARLAGTVLAVGLVGRQSSGARWIRDAIASGRLGTIDTIDLEYGGAFSWRLASGSLFNKAQAGGGVLIDLGTHALDLLIWWLGVPDVVEYSDDAMGGVEAECRLVLSFPGVETPVRATVLLSRLRNLSNVVRVGSDQGALEWNVATDAVTLQRHAGRVNAGMTPVLPSSSIHDLFAAQLRAFARAVSGMAEPTVNGERALAVVDLIQRCYQVRRPSEEPWAAGAW